MKDLKQQIYRVFDPAPLDDASEREALYVDLESVRGDSPVLDMLASRIELAGTHTVQLLAGHAGSGKSTELHRLKARLEQEHFFVVVTDVARSGRDVDLSDFDFPELLVVVLRELVEALEKLGISLEPGYFGDLFARLKDTLFSEWEIDQLTLKTGFVELGGAVRTPETRRRIRDLIAPSAKNWLVAANDLLDRARSKLKEFGRKDIVLIVDGLDKLVDGERDRAGWRDNLYKDRRPEMGGFRCHVVYTIPLDIVLTSRGQVIASLYDMAQIPVVPMVKVRKRPPETAAHAAGVKLFREVVSRRLHRAGVADEDIFKSGVLNELIKVSGGQLRQLMLMIRDACARDIPIRKETVQQVIRGYRLQFSYWLGSTHWPLIRQAEKSGRVPPTDENHEALSELLESRALLHYRNDDQWYGANPLLPPAPREAPARRPSSRRK